MNDTTKQFRKISELHNWENNPRSITEEGIERLIKQIKKLGVYKPLLITEDGTILGGNMRFKALQQMGEKEVWVSVVDAPTEEKKIEYALSDNDRVGKYEADDLANLIGNFPTVEWGDYSVDIKEPELVSELMDKFSETEEDEAPAVQEGEAESKLGEVYQLGRHRLMCGDSTDAGSVAILMNGQKADMVFTDPPYGMDYSGRGENTSNKIMNDDIDPTIFYNIGSEITERYIWGRVENYKHLKTKPRDVIIWKKNNFGMGSGYRGQYECCFYYGNFNGSDSDVWEINKDGKYMHPTQKPVHLAVRAIRNSSPNIVIDYFGGSGSTLIACEQTNRTCYMMELDPHYCDVIRKRYQNYIDKREKQG